MEIAEGLDPARRRRRVSRRGLLGIVLVVFALVWSAAWFYMPPIVASQAEKAAAEKLGRRLTLGHVAFNPWTLELTIDDLAIAGASPGEAPQLQVKRIYANAAWTSLLRFAPVIDALEIDAPALRLTHVGEGRYDVDAMLQRLVAAYAGHSDEAARFALHNIVVRGGAIDFVDTPVAETHRVRGIELGIPFLSSLPSEREIRVEPHLAFELDGSRFDSTATATPWADRDRGEAKLHLDRFDIARFLVYLPRGLPVRPQSALLSADLRLAFEQRPTLTLRLSGTVDISGIKVVDAAAQELLQAGSVRIAIDDLRPLEGAVHLSRIDIDAPHVLAQRNAAGRVNLLLVAGDSAGEPVPVARVPLPTTAASAAQTAASAAAAPPAAAPRWKVTLAALSIRAGQLDWRDATTAPAAALALGDFSFDAEAIGWPLDAPVVFKGTGVLGSDKVHGKLAFSGQGNAAGAAVQVGLDALPLAVLRPYLRSVLTPDLNGDLSADLALEWRPAADGPQLKVDAKRIAVAALGLGEAKSPEVAGELIEFLDAHVDTAARAAAIGHLTLRAPSVRVERDAERRWSFERWTRGATAATPQATAAVLAPASPASAAPRVAAKSGAGGWKLGLGEVTIDKGRARFADRGQRVPVAFDLSELALQLHGWARDAAPAAPFHLAARVAVPAGPTGKAVGSGVVGSIDARGELRALAGGVPAAGKVALLLKDLPLHLLAPYFDDVVDIEVQKAQTSLKGDLAWERSDAGTKLRVRGDATIDDFRASNAATDRLAPQRALTLLRDATTARPLLDWKSLSLRGIDVTLAPGTATRIAVAETTLSDFYARIVLDENGHLNLQDVTHGSAAASPPAAASAPAPPAIVELGPIAVVGGRVVYNDRFVKPSYSANLSELAGKLGAFSSQAPAPGMPPALAELALSGRVEGTATLEISGKVNPLARPLALDIQAKVRDLELPPLSPYAIKYSGYGIERGKMSVDLAYVVLPDGQLTASNKIVLHQLAFGDKVEGATASLPVKLAVALLTDRHGVIDLDLPVSGSINDPQFSLGAVIWKVVTNLIVKAVTAPFALLASALEGRGGGELSSVEFAAGTATLSPEAKAGLDKLAKALANRPALTLTVSGESRLEVERDAWKRERLQQAVRSEKRRQAIAGGAAADAEVTVGEREYSALLKEVYKRADIVKPKNIFGLAKDLPPAEMEALLLASINVGDEAMQQLAVRRAVAVRDYLASKELPTSRLFLGAPKTVHDDAAAWKPRADLALAPA